ncbi:MAG: hypothetical protein NTW87_18475 [Planctomycetota bacterium]|nr:hypothetical protein [Planctomycetota bacterium]
MSAKIAAAQQAALVYDGEDVERCRQARRAFEKRFKTLDAMFDYCERLRKRRGVRTGRSRPVCGFAGVIGRPRDAAKKAPRPLGGKRAVAHECHGKPAART